MFLESSVRAATSSQKIWSKPSKIAETSRAIQSFAFLNICGLTDAFSFKQSLEEPRYYCYHFLLSFYAATRLNDWWHPWDACHSGHTGNKDHSVSVSQEGQAEGMSMLNQCSQAVKHSEAIPSAPLRSEGRQSIKHKSKVSSRSSKHITVFETQQIERGTKNWK